MGGRAISRRIQRVTNQVHVTPRISYIQSARLPRYSWRLEPHISLLAIMPPKKQTTPYDFTREPRYKVCERCKNVQDTHKGERVYTCLGKEGRSARDLCVSCMEHYEEKRNGPGGTVSREEGTFGVSEQMGRPSFATKAEAFAIDFTETQHVSHQYGRERSAPDAERIRKANAAAQRAASNHGGK